MSTTTLTRPEQATERALAKRQRDKVTAAGGCPYCLHRLTNWGGCTKGLSFPLCTKPRVIEFEPDYQRLTGEPA